MEGVGGGLELASRCPVAKKQNAPKSLARNGYFMVEAAGIEPATRHGYTMKTPLTIPPETAPSRSFVQPIVQ